MGIFAMINFPIVLEDSLDSPLYKQLATALRKAISDGKLAAGQMMPSTRELSARLGISRFTVIQSFDLLTSQGYLQTGRGSGTYVSRQPPGGCSADHQSTTEQPLVASQADSADLRLSGFARRVMHQENVTLFSALNYGAPADEHLPLKSWRQLTLKQMRSGTIEHFSDPLGYRPLRESIAGYLNRARSVSCSPDQVVVFSGPSSSFDFIARLLIDEGDSVAMENPGFRHGRRLFQAHGARVHDVEVDEDGIRVDKLTDINRALRLVYVTPSHQDPTGFVLSLPRRLDLLEWARRSGALILEDDFDKEYRYATRPVPALQALDKNDCVIYVSSFWRVLFPIVRTSFAVFPDRLMDSVLRLRGMLEREVPVMEQRILSEFIEEGRLERHIKRMRSVYAVRRLALIRSLVRRFGRKVWLHKESSGLHLMVRFNIDLDDEEILARAEGSALPIVSTAAFYSGEGRKGEFIIPFGHLDAEHIENSVGELFNRLNTQN